MKRKQTTFGNLRQFLWIFALAIVYSFHALDVIPAHASNSHSLAGFQTAYDKSSENCHDVNDVANNSQQGKPRNKCCLHCVNIYSSHHNYVIPVNVSNVIETLVPDRSVSGFILERDDLKAHPRELYRALLATRGPPLFS